MAGCTGENTDIHDKYTAKYKSVILTEKLDNKTRMPVQDTSVDLTDDHECHGINMQ